MFPSPLHVIPMNSSCIIATSKSPWYLENLLFMLNSLPKKFLKMLSKLLLLLPKMYFPQEPQVKSHLGNLTSDQSSTSLVSIANHSCVGITFSQIWQGKKNNLTGAPAASGEALLRGNSNNHAFTLTSLFNTWLDWGCRIYCYIYHYSCHFVHLILDHIKYLLMKKKFES